MVIEINFQKLPAEKHMGMWIGPSGGTTLGVTDEDIPLAAEINNTGGTSGVVMAAHTVDWNDLSFGLQESERNNQPSLADSASYETFGASNYSGDVSMFLPADYDDNSNLHSLIYDLTDQPLVINDIVTRVDGDIDATAPAADGQFVSVYRAQAGSETNPFTPGESKRRTVGYLSRGQFSFYRPVGAQTITAIAPSAFGVGDKGRIRLSVQGRDVTNATWYRWGTSDGDVIQAYPGGYFEVTGVATDTATVTVTDTKTGLSATVSVTVTA